MSSSKRSTSSAEQVSPHSRWRSAGQPKKYANISHGTRALRNGSQAIQESTTSASCPREISHAFRSVRSRSITLRRTPGCKRSPHARHKVSTPFIASRAFSGHVDSVVLFEPDAKSLAEKIRWSFDEQYGDLESYSRRYKHENSWTNSAKRLADATTLNSDISRPDESGRSNNRAHSLQAIG